MTIRVALWTTGNIAKFAGRAIVEHPDLELVGAYSWSESKAGTDVGTLIGIDPIGIVSTHDIEELIATKPDVVGYYPIMNPDEVPGHVEDVCRLLEAGINVVSSANIVTGRWWNAEDRFEEAGVRGNASLFGAGVNPGWVNQLLLTASGACSSVSKLSVWEEAECSGYASPELWETVAFGHPPDEPGIEEHFKRGISVFEDTVAMMADALDLELDEIAYVPEVAIAKKDLDLGWMLIPEGTVAGLKSRSVGRVGGHDVIELGTVWKMTEDVEPELGDPPRVAPPGRRRADDQDACGRLARRRLDRGLGGVDEHRHGDDGDAHGARDPARRAARPGVRHVQGPPVDHRRRSAASASQCMAAALR